MPYPIALAWLDIFKNWRRQRVWSSLYGVLKSYFLLRRVSTGSRNNLQRRQHLTGCVQLPFLAECHFRVFNCPLGNFPCRTRACNADLAPESELISVFRSRLRIFPEHVIRPEHELVGLNTPPNQVLKAQCLGRSAVWLALLLRLLSHHSRD